nr:Coiled-coil domain-containing protein 13 [Polyrhizophydium stewartii]
MPAVVPLPASNRPLFGGAISVPVPTSFIDASQLREVPDHQEVFVDMNSDSSFIVELLEAEQPGEDPVAAARRHFEQLASDNEVRPEDCRILAVESLSNMMMALERPGIRATVLFGTQRIAKFNERGESAMNTVGIMMGLVQLGDVTTDVLITFNKTLQFGRESSSLLRFGDSAESGYEVSLGRFADMMRGGLSLIAAGFEEDPFETSESDTDSVPVGLEEEIEASLFGTQEHVSQDREQPLVVLESAEAAKVNIKPRKARNAQLTRIKVDGEVRQNPLLESKVIDWDLRARLAQLEQANSQLKFDLRNRDKEIKSLRKEMTAGITLAGTEDAIAETISKAGAGKDGKIIELAKKARRLTVAYEREKALNASLANQLKSESSQRKDQVTSQHKAPTNGEHDPQKDVGNHTQVKSFKEKLAQPKQMSRKLEEERMTSMNLKSELRLAQKALVQEIGEEVPIQKIGSWRGRSEQIALLKDKVRDLSRKLASRAAAPAGAGESDREGSGADGREAIQRIEQVRRVELDRLSAELEQVRQEHAESRTRCDGLAARNRTLEREVKDLKCKLARMLGKSETDDQLVRALQEQIQRAKGENEPLHEQPAERVKQQRPAKERDVPGGRGRAGELQALQSKIEMLADENESLRLSLRLATEAKTRDLDTYKRLLEETRAMFESDIQAIVQRAEATQPALASDGKNM